MFICCNFGLCLFSISLFVICLFAIISGSVRFLYLCCLFICCNFGLCLFCVVASFSLSVLCCLSSALLLRFLCLLLTTSHFSKHTLILHCAIACHSTTSDKGLYSHRPPNSDHYPLGIGRTGNNSDYYALGIVKNGNKSKATGKKRQIKIAANCINNEIIFITVIIIVIFFGSVVWIVFTVIRETIIGIIISTTSTSSLSRHIYSIY